MRHSTNRGFSYAYFSKTSSLDLHTFSMFWFFASQKTNAQNFFLYYSMWVHVCSNAGVAIMGQILTALLVIFLALRRRVEVWITKDFSRSKSNVQIMESFELQRLKLYICCHNNFLRTNLDGTAERHSNWWWSCKLWEFKWLTMPLVQSLLWYL